MSLPIFQDANKNLMLMQTGWSSQLNPILQSPLSSNNILTEVALAAGSNTINHKLQRKLQGWIIIRKRADAAIYDTQDQNVTPQNTLLLTSDVDVTVDLLVF